MSRVKDPVYCHCGTVHERSHIHSCSPELDQVIAKLEKRLARAIKPPSDSIGGFEWSGRVTELRYALRLLKAGLRGLR